VLTSSIPKPELCQDHAIRDDEIQPAVPDLPEKGDERGKTFLFEIPRLLSQKTVFAWHFGFRGIRRTQFLQNLPVFSLYPKNDVKSAAV